MGKGNRLLAILTIFVLLAGFSPIRSGYGANKISFGLTLPLTGSLKETGDLVLNAYKFWAKQMNARGGILIAENRYPVELVFYDNRSNPQLCAKFIEKLINDDKVDLLLGGREESLLGAASAVADRYGYPLIAAGVKSDAFFGRGSESCFSLDGKLSDEVQACVEMLKGLKPRPKTVAIVGVNTPFFSLVCDKFKASFADSGFEIVHFGFFPAGMIDYEAMLKKIQRKNPDIFLVGSRFREAAETLRAIKKICFLPKGIFSYGPPVFGLVKATEGEGENLFAVSGWASRLPYKGPVFGSASDFDGVYFRECGRHPTDVEAAAVAAAVIQQVTLGRFGFAPPYLGTDREALVDKLRKFDEETFYGRVRFGKDGANTTHTPIVVQVRKGRALIVFPRELREVSPVYPIPAGKE